MDRRLRCGHRGLDIVVFAGGIGENAPVIRSRVCEGLGFLGIELDEERNSTIEGDGAISAAHSRVDVRVIHTDEERVIAQMTGQVLGLTPTNRHHRDDSGGNPLRQGDG